MRMADLIDDIWKNKIIEIAEGMENGDRKIEKCYVAETCDAVIGFIYGFVIPHKLLMPQMLYMLSEYRENGIGTQLLECFEKLSDCSCAIIFYHKTLHDYYSNRGYDTLENMETAMKELI